MFGKVEFVFWNKNFMFWEVELEDREFEYGEPVSCVSSRCHRQHQTCDQRQLNESALHVDPLQSVALLAGEEWIAARTFLAEDRLAVVRSMKSRSSGEFARTQHRQLQLNELTKIRRKFF